MRGNLAHRAPVLMTACLLFSVLGPTGKAAASTPPCPANPREVHAIPGWLHSCGSFLADARGHVVRPITVSFWDMSPDTGRNPDLCRHWAQPSAGASDAMQRWGFNSVLLYVSWANVEPRRPTYRRGVLIHHYSQTYLTALDGVIQDFANRGVKVILDMGNNRWSSAFTNMTLPNGFMVPCGSGMPAWLYPRGGGITQMALAEKGFFSGDARSRRLQRWFGRAWGAVAKRYRRDRAVIGAVILHEAYDLLAQPYPGAEGLRPRNLHLARFYERAGKAIRSADPHLVLFTPDRLDWSTNRFALTRAPQLANSVETFEFYAPNWTHSGHPRLDAYVARASAWHRPAWAEEYSAFLPTDSRKQPSATWAQSAAGFEAAARDHFSGWSFCPSFRLPDNPTGLLGVLQDGF